MREATRTLNGMDILIRAFANVSGLSEALERGGRVNDTSQLRAFATGFSNRQAFFDFVDIGSGKERTDRKIKGEYRFVFVALSNLVDILSFTSTRCFMILMRETPHRECQFFCRKFPV